MTSPIKPSVKVPQPASAGLRELLTADRSAHGQDQGQDQGAAELAGTETALSGRALYKAMQRNGTTTLSGDPTLIQKAPSLVAMPAPMAMELTGSTSRAVQVPEGIMLPRSSNKKGVLTGTRFSAERQEAQWWAVALSNWASDKITTVIEDATPEIKKFGIDMPLLIAQASALYAGYGTAAVIGPAGSGGVADSLGQSVGFREGESHSDLFSRIDKQAVKQISEVALEGFILPQLRSKHPRDYGDFRRLQKLLTPPWARNDRDNPLGWKIPPSDAQHAYHLLVDEMTKLPSSPTDAHTNRFLRLISALTMSRIGSGAATQQSYFFKLLREIGPQQRQTIFKLLIDVSSSSTPYNMIEGGLLSEFAVLSKTMVQSDTIGENDAAKLGVAALGTAAAINGPHAMGRGAALDKIRLQKSAQDALAMAVTGLGMGEERSQLIILIISQQFEHIVLDVSRVVQLAPEWGADILPLLNDLFRKGTLEETTWGLAEVDAALRKFESSEGYLNSPHKEVFEQVIASINSRLKWVTGLTAQALDVRFERLLEGEQSIPANTKPIAVSHFFAGDVYTSDNQGKPDGDVAQGNVDRRVLTAAKTGMPQRLGGSDTSPTIKVSVVLEGGGGKGFVYPEMVKETFAMLSKSKALGYEVDEFVGTSAGAITAMFLAAGFRGEELSEVMKSIDFNRFYADQENLMSGANPLVGGLNRTGLFSMSEMYKVLSEQLHKKLGIPADRPVLFKDLPANLKVVSTVTATNIPDAMKKELKIGDEGKITFGKENTPNMEVVAAVIASAAVPLFFDAPRMELAVPVEEFGETKMQRYWMEFIDGGVVNNLPIAETTKGDDNDMLLMLPAFYGRDGFDAETLSTLAFESDGLGGLNSLNKDTLHNFLGEGKLNTLMQAAEQSGTKRVSIAFNLDTKEGQQSRVDADRPDQLTVSQGLPTDFNDAARTHQLAPIIQGVNAAHSKRFAALAKANGVLTEPSTTAQNIIEANLAGLIPDDVLTVDAIEAVVDNKSVGRNISSLITRAPEEAVSLTDTLKGLGGMLHTWATPIARNMLQHIPFMPDDFTAKSLAIDTKGGAFEVDADGQRHLQLEDTTTKNALAVVRATIGAIGTRKQKNYLFEKR